MAKDKDIKRKYLILYRRAMEELLSESPKENILTSSSLKKLRSKLQITQEDHETVETRVRRRLGVSSIDSEDYTARLDYYNTILAKDKKDIDAWVGKGEALYHLGQDLRAIKCFEKALKLDANFEEAWYYQGLSLTELEDYDKALESFDKAIRLFHEFKQAWLASGITLNKKGEHKKALACVNKAMKIDSKFLPSIIGQLIIEFDIEDYEACIASADKALETFPKHEEILSFRRESKRALNQPSEELGPNKGDEIPLKDMGDEIIITKDLSNDHEMDIPILEMVPEEEMVDQLQELEVLEEIETIYESDTESDVHAIEDEEKLPSKINAEDTEEELPLAEVVYESDEDSEEEMENNLEELMTLQPLEEMEDKGEKALEESEKLMEDIIDEIESEADEIIEEKAKKENKSLNVKEDLFEEEGETTYKSDFDSYEFVRPEKEDILIECSACGDLIPNDVSICPLCEATINDSTVEEEEPEQKPEGKEEDLEESEDSTSLQNQNDRQEEEPKIRKRSRAKKERRSLVQLREARKAREKPKKYRARRLYAGVDRIHKLIKCPKCGSPVVIPSAIRPITVSCSACGAYGQLA